MIQRENDVDGLKHNFRYGAFWLNVKGIDYMNLQNINTMQLRE